MRRPTGVTDMTELLALLKEAQALGLTFHRGAAYISAAYIEKQTELNARIEQAIAKHKVPNA